MKIGIIGAGQIGGTLTRRLTALGHEVFVANSRGPKTLSDLAAETGATAVSVPEAVRGMDLIVVTIPQKNIPSLPAGLLCERMGHASPERSVPARASGERGKLSSRANTLPVPRGRMPRGVE